MSSDHSVTLWYGLKNDRVTPKKFLRLFFINYVRGQAGKHRNSTKCLEKKMVSVMLSVYCVKVLGGVRAEKLEGWLPLSFLTSLKLLNLLRYLPQCQFNIHVLSLHLMTIFPCINIFGRLSCCQFNIIARFDISWSSGVLKPCRGFTMVVLVITSLVRYF